MSTQTSFVISCAGAALGLGVLFGVGTASFDFPCLAGFDATGLGGDLPKGTAMLRAFGFSGQHLGQVAPVVAGFTVIFAAALLAPMAAARQSHTQILMGLALLPLILGCAAWIAIGGPKTDCTLAPAASYLLSRAAIGAVVLITGAFLIGRRRDRAR